MKRGAEKQLVKDGPDDDDIEEIQESQGFQKADDTALAKRQMRGLPKRALAPSRPPSLNGLPPTSVPDVDKVETAPQPKFGGFVGFGAGNAASNPFTFATQPATTPASSVFDTVSSAEKSAPTIKAGTSSLFTGATTLFPSVSDAPPPQPTTSPSVEEKDAVAFKYFKSLRGLNVSFLSAISAAVEKDPFFDVAGLVESYKNLRTTIQSEFDDSSKQTNPVTTFAPKALQEKNIFFMPKPSAAADASKSPPASESGTKTGGFSFPPFVPPSSSTQLPFGLTSKSSSSSSTEQAKSVFPHPPSTSASVSSFPPTPGFSFATPLNVENNASKSISGALDQNADSSTSSLLQPTSAVPAAGSSNVPSFFGSKTTSAFTTSDAASKTTSVFGSSIFGNSTATESNKTPSFNLPSSDSKDSSKAPTALFGNVASTSSSSSSTSIFGSSSDKPVSFFGSASPPKTSPFTFGKPGGSIGNPVGFGFGSSLSTGDTAAPVSSSSGFSFGAPSTKPSESLFSPPVTDKSSESTPQPEAEDNEEGGEDEAVKLLPSHAHDEEGEGEEDEETMHSTRCKLYRLSKLEDKSEWKDLGIGIFRLKKHKETNVRRVLMRNSNTGRILINFRIYEGLKPSLVKTAISFIGYENRTPTSFRVRLKTEEQAGDLKEALEREIAAVQTTV